MEITRHAHSGGVAGSAEDEVGEVGGGEDEGVGGGDGERVGGWADGGGGGSSRCGGWGR